MAKMYVLKVKGKKNKDKTFLNFVTQQKKTAGTWSLVEKKQRNYQLL